jgi:hypothetical protein
MQIATFMIAVAGLVLSTISLGWQGIAHVLTGRRVKVDLITGASLPDFTEMQVSHGAPPSPITTLRSQGYTIPIVGVRVRNVGRTSLTVTDWNFACYRGWLPWFPFARREFPFSVGGPVPCRLETGEGEEWLTRWSLVENDVSVVAEARKIPVTRVRVRCRVRLGDGRVRVTRKSVRIKTASFRLGV